VAALRGRRRCILSAMTANPIARLSKDANRLHCITNGRRSRYRLRIEDADGSPLTEFVNVSRADAASSVQLSTLAGQIEKEDLRVLQGGEEDYRLPIVNEDIIRAKLDPEGQAIY
jgi:hypothetical protein